MATIKDVARMAEVSTATVARYLKQPEIVSDESKARIKIAIKELGYEPNSIASMLKSMRSNIVGLIISDVTNPFFNNLIRSLNKLFLDSHKRLIVVYDDENVDFVGQIRVMISLRVEAVMFIPTRKSQTIENLLIHNNCYPLQLFIDHYNIFDSLTINDRLGTYLAAKELIDNKHRNLLLIDFDNDIYRERLAGFKDALAEARIAFDESMTCSLSDRDFMSHHDDIKRAIKDAKATGVISVTDTLTKNVFSSMSSLGKIIYHDYSLVMYDESDWAKLQDVTTISHPFAEMTQKIQNLLLKNLDNHASKKFDAPEKVIINPLIIRRNSVRTI